MGKKQAVALQKSFFDTLPQMPTTKPANADIAWLLYDLKRDSAGKQYDLKLSDIVYTEFDAALDSISKPVPGNVQDFVEVLQHKLDEKLEGHAPDNATLTDIIPQ